MDRIIDHDFQLIGIKSNFPWCIKPIGSVNSDFTHCFNIKSKAKDVVTSFALLSVLNTTDNQFTPTPTSEMVNWR